MDVEIATRLDRIEALLTVLVGQQQVKDFYEVEEFARLVGKVPFTVREWARLGRIHGLKRRSGRGAHPSWAIAHDELLRFQREGLLPLRRRLEQHSGLKRDSGRAGRD